MRSPSPHVRWLQLPSQHQQNGVSLRTVQAHLKFRMGVGNLKSSYPWDEVPWGVEFWYHLILVTAQVNLKFHVGRNFGIILSLWTVQVSIGLRFKCLNTNNRRPCSSTLSRHPSSSWRPTSISCEKVAITKIAILPQLLTSNVHLVRKSYDGLTKIAILPQFLTSNVHFVRKGCDN